MEIYKGMCNKQAWANEAQAQAFESQAKASAIINAEEFHKFKKKSYSYLCLHTVSTVVYSTVRWLENAFIVTLIESKSLFFINYKHISV